MVSSVCGVFEGIELRVAQRLEGLLQALKRETALRFSMFGSRNREVK